MVLLLLLLNPQRPAGIRRLSKARTSPLTSRVHRGNHKATLKDHLRLPTREAVASAAAAAAGALRPLPRQLTPLGQAQSPLSLLPVEVIKEVAEEEEEEDTEPGGVAGTNRRKDREGSVELRLAKRLRT